MCACVRAQPQSLFLHILSNAHGALPLPFPAPTAGGLGLVATLEQHTYLGENTKGKLGTRITPCQACPMSSLESFKQKAGGCKGFNVTIK